MVQTHDQLIPRDSRPRGKLSKVSKVLEHRLKKKTRRYIPKGERKTGTLSSETSSVWCGER